MKCITVIHPVILLLVDKLFPLYAGEPLELPQGSLVAPGPHVAELEKDFHLFSVEVE